MKKKKFKLKYFYILMSSIFGGIGIIFIIISIGLLIHGNYVKENYYLTQGLVVDVITKGDSGDVYVSYYHIEGDKIFEGDYEYLNYYTSSIDKGDIINIYINPLTGDIEYIEFLASYILGGISIIFISVGIVFLVILIRNKNKRLKYIKHGYKIYAKIIGYEKVKYVTFNDEYPYKVKCEYEDIFGKKTTFISDSILLDEIDFCGERYVAVYLLNKKDFKKYYVDLDDIKGKIEIIMY